MKYKYIKIYIKKIYIKKCLLLKNFVSLPNELVENIALQFKDNCAGYVSLYQTNRQFKEQIDYFVYNLSFENAIKLFKDGNCIIINIANDRSDFNYNILLFELVRNKHHKLFIQIARKFRAKKIYLPILNLLFYDISNIYVMRDKDICTLNDNDFLVYILNNDYAEIRRTRSSTQSNKIEIIVPHIIWNAIITDAYEILDTVFRITKDMLDDNMFTEYMISIMGNNNNNEDNENDEDNENNENNENENITDYIYPQSRPIYFGLLQNLLKYSPTSINPRIFYVYLYQLASLGNDDLAYDILQNYKGQKLADLLVNISDMRAIISNHMIKTFTYLLEQPEFWVFNKKDINNDIYKILNEVKAKYPDENFDDFTNILNASGHESSITEPIYIPIGPIHPNS